MGHWDSYYASGQVPDLPSQFAVFIANEFPESTAVLDVGCGNGRDSGFFMRQGKRVVGVDRSQTAVDHCRAHIGGCARFLVGSVEQPQLWDTLAGELQDEGGPLLVYARFFLHAIDEAAETVLLNGAARLLADRPGALCIECRTARDRTGEKVTPDHYRRYLEPAQLHRRLQGAGFEVDYAIEGFGFAKYKADDAHVLRVIASRG